jgi:Na+-transporting methylmalonyl-CoA/oxaloacetate decarboxylase gamma subunit
LRENTPVAFVILALVLLVVIVATMSWLIQHPPAHHH